jgi:hypothetical protein
VEHKSAVATHVTPACLPILIWIRIHLSRRKRVTAIIPISFRVSVIAGRPGCVTRTARIITLLARSPTVLHVVNDLFCRQPER